jgi:alpha-beta hydrolase superfamily lysophospholipase
MPPTVFYLHGYASSPDYSMAQFFVERAAERGLALRRPDLNVPDFEHLTMTAMLEKMAEEVRDCPPGPVYLIGASLGGSVALHLADRNRAGEGPRVRKLLLIAPALDMARRWKARIGDKAVEQWCETGWLDTYHYAYEQATRLHYGFYEDVGRYDAFATDVRVPTLIFHGIDDEAVDYRLSVRYAETRPNVDLRLVEGDHQLLARSDEIWRAAVDFFQI